MAMLAISSAHGSPGATSAALGLTVFWPRPVVLVEADPCGASSLAAGFFQGAQMPHDRTIVDLAIAARQGQMAAELPQALLSIPGTQHAQWLRGSIDHAQSATLAQMWDSFAGVLHALERNGQDVIVDCGRLGSEGFAMPLFRAATLSLLAVRSNLRSIVAAGSWAETLREYAYTAGSIDDLGLLVIGPNQPYRQHEIEQALTMPTLATIPWSPKDIGVLSDGETQRRFDRSTLGRALSSEADQLRQRLAARTSTGGV